VAASVLAQAEHTGAGGVADSQRDAASVRISQAPVLEGCCHHTAAAPCGGAVARWATGAVSRSPCGNGR